MKITDNDRTRIADEIEELKREINKGLDNIKDLIAGNDLPEEYKEGYVCSEDSLARIDSEIGGLKQNIDYLDDFIKAWDRIIY